MTKVLSILEPQKAYRSEYRSKKLQLQIDPRQIPLVKSRKTLTTINSGKYYCFKVYTGTFMLLK